VTSLKLLLIGDTPSPTTYLGGILGQLDGNGRSNTGHEGRVLIRRRSLSWSRQGSTQHRCDIWLHFS